ncbi:MAG: hypothetical protein KKE17_15680 [Proteobacteria bacterium]|nr:hypothetical protein [Nanoarchaeota archaeon]MBU1711437.1 hypothetical protein [Pseudomonadota bacterium]
MNIVQELSENQTILLLIPSVEYNSIIIGIAKQLSEKKVCYVTLNKTSGSLKEQFKKKNVNIKNIVFIDVVSKTIKKDFDHMTGCYFVSSQKVLTKLSSTISEILKHEFDYLIFDSLTSLLIYQKTDLVVKFIFSLINKIKESKVKAVFYTLNIKEQERFIQESSLFVDKVINLDKK